MELKIADIAVHPRLAVVPTILENLEQLKKMHMDGANADRVERLTSDWTAFVGDIQANGIKEPLKVTKSDGLILLVDGRNRLAGAEATGLEEVPIVWVQAEDVDKILEATVIGRRHWSKSMKAFMAVKMHPGIALNTKATGNLSRSHKMGTDKMGTLTRESIAGKYGVSSSLIDQACELYKKLYDANGKQTKLGKLIEPRVWLGCSLGGLLAGAGALDSSSAAKPGESRKPSSLAGVSTALRSLASRMSGYTEWPEEDKVALQDEWKRAWAAMPEEARQVLITELE
jgi:hypothetical protein